VLGPAGESGLAHLGLSALDKTGSLPHSSTGVWLAGRIRLTGGEWPGKEVLGS
jgi:hypothetical protein